MAGRRGPNPPDKPRSNSPYCVRNYLDVNPRYGTKEDFKHLVAAIHSRGMRVLMNWVPNHTSWGNDLIRTHPEFYQKDKDDHIGEASSTWRDVAKLDYSRRSWPSAGKLSYTKLWINTLPFSFCLPLSAHSRCCAGRGATDPRKPGGAQDAIDRAWPRAPGESSAQLARRSSSWIIEADP